MDILWIPLLKLTGAIIHFYIWIVLIGVILNWLATFGIINSSHPLVITVSRIIDNLTEPVLRPLRRVLPVFGNLDLSPLILILICYFLENIISILILKATTLSAISFLQK